MPWEWTEPLVQWEKSKESWYGGSSSYNTAVQDRGTSYPAQLSFVCWSHCFYPDWMKSQALFCLALLMALDKCWGKNSYWSLSARDNKTQKNSTFSTVNQVLTATNCRIFRSVYNYLTGQKACKATVALTNESSWHQYTAASIPSSVMMGILAPVVTEVCLANPWTGLFSGEDLSIPGGVKPEWTHNKYLVFHQKQQTQVKNKDAECDAARSNISPYIIDVTYGSFCFL